MTEVGNKAVEEINAIKGTLDIFLRISVDPKKVKTIKDFQTPDSLNPVYFVLGLTLTTGGS